MTPQHVTNISWAHDYWAHHPYTPSDLISNVQLVATTENTDAASFAEFRLGMAGRLLEEDWYGMLALSYWCAHDDAAHPIDEHNDSVQTKQAYARFHPGMLYLPLNDY